MIQYQELRRIWLEDELSSSRGEEPKTEGEALPWSRNLKADRDFSPRHDPHIMLLKIAEWSDIGSDKNQWLLAPIDVYPEAVMKRLAVNPKSGQGEVLDMLIVHRGSYRCFRLNKMADPEPDTETADSQRRE